MDLKFSNGIDYTFEESKILIPAQGYPNNYLILAQNESAYQSAYPGAMAPYGSFSGTLSNAGELLKLVDFFGRTVDSIFYGDDLPWDIIADQGLHSLALIELDLDNSSSENWKTQDISATPGLIITFADSNNDGVCDFNDICTGGDDNVDVDLDGIPDDCDDCLINIINQAQERIDKNASVTQFIETNGFIENGYDIKYTATEYIRLDPLFEVKLGAVFTALIEGCD